MRISDWSSDVCSSDLGVGFGAAPDITWLLVSAGAVTAVPLLLFATAARRMSYAALGFCQYLTPSLVFLLRSEEHTSELQSLMRISYAVFCLKKKKKTLSLPQITQKHKHK